MSSAFAFLHHVAAFTLVAALAVEFVLIRDELTLNSARKLVAADAVFGASAGLVLAIGLLRVSYFEKGAAYCSCASACCRSIAESTRFGALTSTLRLARLRYENGLASQLEVIDAERNLLAAEIARHEALRAQRAAVADLYKALGG